MKLLKKSRTFLVIGFIMIAAIACIISCQEAKTTDSYLDFPDKLTYKTPYDVDTALESKLISEHKFGEVQRIFEVLSWQMFVGLNWPLSKDGQPKDNISDPGERGWEHWKESYEVFKANGAAPTAFGGKADLPTPLKGKVNLADDEEILFRTSKLDNFDRDRYKAGKGFKASAALDEVDQAFTAPIWDQSGNMVRYEIRLNKPTVAYIEKNELYNLDGQIVFSNQKKIVSFPVSTVEKPGTIELKFAWKVMVKGTDDFDRYFTKKAVVIEPDSQRRHVVVGLVGMHIGIKTVSSPQWIWATFEHVDNVETNALTKVNGHYLRPSFNNPDSSICPIDLYPTGSKTKRNQVQRIIPIPVATQELNKQVQGILRKNNSFWQYYQLIGTQWPTQPSAPAYPLNSTKYNLPQAVTNKSGGNPMPVYLTNMVMETYFQGNTDATDTLTYNRQIANAPAFNQIEGNPKVDPANTLKIIFGTESCIGCHSSASIAIRDTMINGCRNPVWGPPRIGDFEWLLKRKAQFKNQKPCPVPGAKK